MPSAKDIRDAAKVRKALSTTVELVGLRESKLPPGAFKVLFDIAKLNKCKRLLVVFDKEGR